MNPRRLELALRKQRLQFDAERQRETLVAGLERIESVLDVVDRARDRAQGLREHAPLLSALAFAAVLYRPRLALRVARRAWVGWMLYRRLGRGLDPLIGFLRRFAS
ncbi:YqjK-like family protein [Aromatoleum petrolei]|uniref:YqjK-like protein n=1 Tax=Aromatoleum petrolei TaxID=76116 RepID=A0ABX1MTE9_9RHOO|nr:YqjK-like family protein [Aromatoleum petrolei]NMF89956.1 hypothetical protein [Aromatoleum petrolei]QTQ36411.1 YqjK-like family protein [Aromatoleum petrolei]